MLTSYQLLDYDVLRIILVFPPKINISIYRSVLSTILFLVFYLKRNNTLYMMQ